MQQQASDTKESNLIQKQQKIIEELLDRLERLEGTVSAMEWELAVVRNVNLLHETLNLFSRMNDIDGRLVEIRFICKFKNWIQNWTKKNKEASEH